jgi:hypothetical protein
MKFEEEEYVKQQEKNKYKDDLNYLINLKKSYGDMSQKEWERFNRKVNYMNDVKLKYLNNIFFNIKSIEICLWRIR